MRRIESMTIFLKFDDNFKMEDLEVNNAKKAILNIITGYCTTQLNVKTEVSTVVIEKHISEILYIDEKFRIIKTKVCPACLQIKQKTVTNTKEGWRWTNHSWYNGENAFEKAMSNMKGLGKKSKYKSKSRENRQDFMEHLTEEQKQLLESILSEGEKNV